MAVEQAKHGNFSISQYLALEADADFKHEYEQGKVLAMTGGPINHGILCGNIYNELRQGLSGNKGDCKAFGSEIRIHIEKAEAIVYPDAMVVCSDLLISSSDPEAVTNPALVAEVLSASTESYDRGNKFFKYRQLDSLREYLLIAQDLPMVETFYRKADNVWEITRFSGLEATLSLKSIGLEIPLQSLYVNVRL